MLEWLRMLFCHENVWVLWSELSSPAKLTAVFHPALMAYFETFASRLRQQSDLRVQKIHHQPIIPNYKLKTLNYNLKHLDVTKYLGGLNLHLFPWKQRRDKTPITARSSDIQSLPEPFCPSHFSYKSETWKFSMPFCQCFS